MASRSLVFEDYLKHEKNMPMPVADTAPRLERAVLSAHRCLSVQMWRVRLCLAGGGREHVGYFANEEAGAAAYNRALERLKKLEGALPARALERHNVERVGRAAPSAAAGAGDVVPRTPSKPGGSE